MTTTAAGPTQESAPQPDEQSPEESPSWSCSWPDCSRGREAEEATATDGKVKPDGCHPGLC
jgi:hypothetical protein